MSTAKEILKKYWGYEEFRSAQEDVITSIISGRDTVALLHTGAGKSLCYQLPALVFSGKTIVVSPLIALMQDQVDSLTKRGVRAAAIYAGMSAREVDITMDNFVHGPIKILYVSPERIETEIFVERFKRADISLIAVDEAHCISQWGYDFRPSYFYVAELRKWKPEVPVIAVTATATQQVVEDICDKLSMSDANIITSTFARENISFSVMITESKEKMLLDVLHKMSGVGIIYLRSRKRVKELSDWLNQRNISAQYYHGGLNMKTRQRIQKQWQDSNTGLIVCTNAFGMGVDKPDVRYVIHLDVPPTMEEYYQEAGRAGRDGYASYAVSIISHADLLRLDYNILQSYPPIEDIKSIYQKLCSFLKIAYGSGEMESKAFDIQGFADKNDISLARVHSILQILEKEGWIMMSEGYKNPSTVLITSDKRTISLSSRNKTLKAEMLLHLVRNYEGIFINHVTIREDKIAEKLDCTADEVKRELKIMERESILHYNPSIDGPKITFLRPRPAKNSFTIDKKRYAFLSERAYQRKDDIVAYMLSKECRQKQLLAYFDEKSDDCGICDVCKGSFDTSYTEEEKQQLRVHLSKKLTRGPIILGDYVLKWPYNKRGKAKACLQSLENEGFIHISDDDVITLSKASI